MGKRIKTYLSSFTVFVIAGLAITVLIFSISLTVNQNWLGLSLQPTKNNHGLKITHIHTDSLKKKLSKNDTIIAIHNPDFGRVAVNSESVRQRPDFSARDSVKQYLTFLENEGRLYNILDKKQVHIVLSNGKSISIPVIKRLITDIPFNFWLEIVIALAALVIGYIVYKKQHKDSAIFHFLVSIAGFFIMACSWAVILNRSVALSSELYRILDALSHLGISILISGLLCMVWSYPRKLEPFALPAAIYTGYALFWLLDSFLLINSPAFAFYSPMFFGFAFITVFAVMQWGVTAKLPADRTVLKLMFFFIYIMCAFLFLFVFIPQTLSSFILIPPNLEYVFFLLFYIGLALILTRYRMINLEFWWSFMWGGYFALSLSAFIYFILMSAFTINPILVLSLATFLGVLSFYPFRQWIKSQFKTAPQSELEHYLPTLVDLLFTSRSDQSLSMQWESILARIFNPITLSSRKNPVASVEIDNDGTVLRVPDFQPEYAIELAYSNKGKRLFVSEDVRLAQTMYELTRQAIDLNQAKNRGAEEERTRIVRDLHDDVGAKLITIIHRAGTTQVADLCRSALQDIRDIMSYLGGGLYELPAMVADWRSEADIRCEAANIKLVWQQTDTLPNIDLDSRTRMNLTRVFREAFTNSIKHAAPSIISASIIYANRKLSFTLKDDGATKDISTFVKGRGLHNMKERIKEIDGTIEWSQNEPHGVTVQVSIEITREG